MTATATVAAAFKWRMFKVAEALWADPNPEVLTTYGRPGINIPDDLVMWLGVESEFVPGPQAMNRQRTETLTLDSQWWFFRPGELDAEKDATDALYTRLGEFENHLRLTNPRLLLDGEGPNEGLDFMHGVQLVSHQFDTTEADNNLGAGGRLAVATVRWQADIRIRNI